MSEFRAEAKEFKPRAEAAEFKPRAEAKEFKPSWATAKPQQPPTNPPMSTVPHHSHSSTQYNKPHSGGQGYPSYNAGGAAGGNYGAHHNQPMYQQPGAFGLPHHHHQQNSYNYGGAGFAPHQQYQQPRPGGYQGGRGGAAAGGHHQHQHADPYNPKRGGGANKAPNAPPTIGQPGPQKQGNKQNSPLSPVGLAPEAPQELSKVAGKPKEITPAVSKLKKLPAFLFLGPRGSGKSTQAKRVAEKYNYLYICSGDIVRDGKHPYLEIRNILEKEFVPGKYKGLALDRFLVTGETDMYYLEYSLNKFDIGIDLAIVLMMDHDEAQKREEARDAAKEDAIKPKSYQRRMMEHRAVYETCTNLFEPIGKLRTVDCDGGKGIEEISTEIFILINEYITKGIHTEPLPPTCLKGNKALQLVPDFEKFTILKNDICTCMDKDQKFADFFPGSTMSGLMDHTKFERMSKNLSAYYLTAKADGQRVLVVKHELGMYLFPSSYQAMYELVPAPPSSVKEPKELKTIDGMELTKPISYIVDAEVITPEVSTSKRLAIYVFDFLFFFGIKGFKTPFPLRYQLFSNYFGLNNSWGTFHAKKFFPIGDLPQEMPTYGEGLPFPIDGIIMQHAQPYKTPVDPNVYKWKPRDLCTVDFRLCDGEEVGEEWHFRGKVSVKKEGRADEETFPKTVIVIPTTTVEADNLADGSVVECIKTDSKQKKDDVWHYHRSRPDKLTPNKQEIAEYTAAMKFMSYKELLQRCAFVGGMKNSPSNSSVGMMSSPTMSSNEMISAPPAASAAKKMPAEGEKKAAQPYRHPHAGGK